MTNIMVPKKKEGMATTNQIAFQKLEIEIHVPEPVKMRWNLTTHPREVIEERKRCCEGKMAMVNLWEEKIPVEEKKRDQETIKMMNLNSGQEKIGIGEKKKDQGMVMVIGNLSQEIIKGKTGGQ
jgi:hypothetical protein